LGFSRLPSTELIHERLEEVASDELRGGLAGVEGFRLLPGYKGLVGREMPDWLLAAGELNIGRPGGEELP
jgi:hypothetical protein